MNSAPSARTIRYLCIVFTCRAPLCLRRPANDHKKNLSAKGGQIDWQRQWGSFSGRLQTSGSNTGKHCAKTLAHKSTRSPPRLSQVQASTPIPMDANGDRRTGRSSGLGSSHFVTFPRLSPQWCPDGCSPYSGGTAPASTGFPVRSVTPVPYAEITENARCLPDEQFFLVGQIVRKRKNHRENSEKISDSLIPLSFLVYS